MVMKISFIADNFSYQKISFNDNQSEPDIHQNKTYLSQLATIKVKIKYTSNIILEFFIFPFI